MGVSPQKQKPIYRKSFVQTDAIGTGGWDAMTYDINNAEFIEFFRKTTGYRLSDCECGWDRVVNVLANPDYPIETIKFTYKKSGSALPEKENQSMINSWAITRQKLQDQWEIFTGVKTFQEVYRSRN